jgi:cyclic pyranopterin phosphate synthase
MPEEEYSFTPTQQLMQAEEIEAIARLFVQEGVKKIRLTGGEPLVRKDFPQILERLSRLPVQLTLTTNGTRVNEMLPAMKAAGIRIIRISKPAIPGRIG